MLITCGLGTLAFICTIGIAYALVKVPKVNADVNSQGTTIYYRDGKTTFAKMGSSRTIVPLGQMSEPARNAVLAAEDRNFYNEPAISPTGIARAVFNNVTGGDTQGGSTITQQYVKNAYLNQDRTLSRKFKELFVAIKIGKQQDKNTILQNYLNTIYFGNGANGIEAAAQRYYKTKAASLTVPQAAVLAANIKQPGYYDPNAKGQQHIDAVQRYNFVLDGMVKMGKLSPADYAKYKDHPPATNRNKGSLLAGQKGYIYQRVKNALHNMGYTDTEIETKGLKVVTTWDPNLQKLAKQAVERKLATLRMPSNTRVGLVTMDPTTGEVLAAYGGKDYLKRFVDDAFYATAQVGSSFKPYVLAAALDQGISLKTTMDATAPKWFNTQGDPVPRGQGMHVVNDEGNPTNPIVDLVTATAKSYNTVYVPLGFKAGSQKVFDIAKASGLPGDAMEKQKGVGGFFLGQTEMTPLTQASGYSTIANDGMFIPPHTIKKVLDSHGRPYHPERFKYPAKRAFRADVAHDVQYAMQSVARQGGTGFRAALPGRQVAGKTGTTNENMAAWFVGFTPKQLVTSVAMWRYDDPITKGKHPRKGRYQPLQHVGGRTHVNGGDFPAAIWHDFMARALEGKEVKTFPPPEWVGENKAYATPKPTPKPSRTTPTEMPTCLPDQEPAEDHCKPQQPTGKKKCKLFPQLPECSGHKSPTPPTEPTCDPDNPFCEPKGRPNTGGFDLAAIRPTFWRPRDG